MTDSVPTGLIAILRGVRSDEVLDIAEGIVAAGFSAIEVPLNSPDPLASIAALVGRFGNEVEIGAGTVLTADQVRECEQAGARIIVAPDTDRPAVAGRHRRSLCRQGLRTPRGHGGESPSLRRTTSACEPCSPAAAKGPQRLRASEGTAGTD